MEILCIWSGESCDSVYQYFYLFLDYKELNIGITIW